MGILQCKKKTENIKKPKFVTLLQTAKNTQRCDSLGSENVVWQLKTSENESIEAQMKRKNLKERYIPVFFAKLVPTSFFI